MGRVNATREYGKTRKAQTVLIVVPSSCTSNATLKEPQCDPSRAGRVHDFGTKGPLSVHSRKHPSLMQRLGNTAPFYHCRLWRQQRIPGPDFDLLLVHVRNGASAM